MNRIEYSRVTTTGPPYVGRLTLGNIQLETPAVFTTLRTIKNPNDLEFLINAKEQYVFDHIQGGVVRLYTAPILLEPQIKMMNEIRSKDQDKVNPKDPFTKFYLSNLLICDPVMEYTKFSKKDYDDKFIDNLWFVSRLERFFKEFEQKKQEILKTKSKSVMELRKEMNSELWLGNSKSDRRERNAMVEQLVHYQLNNYSVITPICPLAETVEELKVCFELNDLCQGLAYGNERDCLSFVPFHRSAIKDSEMMGMYLDHIKKNKNTKLNALKFRDLDLHCPVDFKARQGFKQFKDEITKFKQEQTDRAFMLFDAGTQYYIAMETFDVINTSMSGFDHDVDGGRRKKGEPLTMSWWDENKMWARPTYDAPLPDPDHCPYCKLVPDFNTVEDKALKRHRRGHRLSDLNKDASAICQAIRGGNLGLIMRRRVANAEFSFANDLIQAP